MLPCSLEVSGPSRGLHGLGLIKPTGWEGIQEADLDLQALYGRNTREKAREKTKGIIPKLCPPHSGPGRRFSRRASFLRVGLAPDEGSG